MTEAKYNDYTSYYEKINKWIDHDNDKRDFVGRLVGVRNINFEQIWQVIQIVESACLYCYADTTNKNCNCENDI